MASTDTEEPLSDDVEMEDHGPVMDMGNGWIFDLTEITESTCSHCGKSFDRRYLSAHEDICKLKLHVRTLLPLVQGE